MGMIAYSSPATLTTGQPLSWADLEILRRNAMALDAISRGPRRAWHDQVGLPLWRFYGSGVGAAMLTRAAFRFRTDMTTLTTKITIDITGGTHTARLSLNGTLVTSQVLSNGDNTLSTTISGRGYADGEIVEVYLDIQRSGGSPMVALCTDMYCTPTTFGLGAYPGVPTFGAISQANMQQLAAAQQWVFDKMDMDQPLGYAIRGKAMYWWPGVGEFWSGGVARSGNLTQLRIPMRFESYPTGPQSEALRLYINGSLIDSETWSRGDAGTFDFVVDLSGYTEHATLRVQMDQIVNTGTGLTRGELGTRFWMGEVRVEDPAPSAGTAPGESTAKESLTFSALQTRLNAIGTLTTAAYTRVNTGTDRWGRQRAYAMMPLIDAFQREYWKDVFPLIGTRRGDLLIVRGTDGTIGYGGVAKRELQSSNLYQDTYRFEEDLISDDQTQTRIIGYDQIPALLAGANYFIRGANVRYAAERLA